MGTVALGLAVLVTGVGCTSRTVGTSAGTRLGQLAGSSALQQFEACDDLLEHVHEEAAAAVGPWGFQTVWGWGDGGVRFAAGLASEGDAAATVSDARAAPAPQGGIGGPDFSGTNVQEAGIDEPDLVKTDGRRLLAVAGGRLRLVDLTGGSPRLAGQLELPAELWDHQLFLAGDRALVIGPGEAPPAPADAVEDGIAPPPGSPSTTVLVVDVADVDAPELLATVHLEGGYVAARLIDGVARLVLQSWPDGSALELTYPEDDSRAAREQAAEANADAVRATTTADWLPAYSVHQQGELGPVVSRGQLTACDQVHHPATFSGVATISVVSVDPADPTPRQAVSVLGAGQTVYANDTSLYVTTTAWPGPGAGEAGALDLTPTPPSELRTDIHRFDIADPAQAHYRASGSVPGQLLNQFSLSEHNDHLRVATTEGSPWAAEEEASSSTVTVLAERDGALVPVGQVGGLGRGERIYAVRFLGDLGYVVTFRETDPLYVIDLSDPAAPRVRGELKILGYSAYLHPIGDGLLLGVGQDATEEGRRLGTQVSLFDVRDPAAPTRIHQLALGPGATEAEYDHHAFLWWARTGTLVLPLQSWGDGELGRPAVQPFTGAVGIDVDPEAGIGEAGRLTHAGRPGAVGGPDDVWASQVRRSVVVGDTLLTLSEQGLLASDLATLADQAWLRF